MEEFIAPILGRIDDITKCSDVVMAEKMLGDGIIVEPNDSKVVSPCNGKVVSIFPTKHAISLVSEQGVELLLHIGIDTVELEGKGFDSLVREGTTVKSGTPLMMVDTEYIKSKNLDPVVVLIVLSKNKSLTKINLGITANKYLPVIQV